MSAEELNNEIRDIRIIASDNDNFFNELRNAEEQIHN